MKKFLLILFIAAFLLPSCTEEDFFSSDTEVDKTTDDEDANETDTSETTGDEVVEETTDDENTEDSTLSYAKIYTKADLIEFRNAVNSGNNTLSAILMSDIYISD